MTQFFEVDKIHNQDCLLTMACLPPACVDLIVTSPPYAGKRGKQYQAPKPQDYGLWFLQRAQEMQRILKPTGSLVINIKEGAENGERQTYVLELILMMRQHGWLWTEEYCWHKKTSYPGKWPNRFRDGWERLLHFTKQKKFKMNQHAVMLPAGDWKEKRFRNPSERDLCRVPNNTGNNLEINRGHLIGRDLVYPDNVLHLAAETRNVGHPAAFPIEIPSWFIKLFSDEGDVVYDPFAGSGTTALAAHTLNRRYIGSELSQEYYEVALSRLADIGD